MLALVTKGRVDDRGTTIELSRKMPSKGYNSVGAVTQGYQISVLYETTARAYPSYILTYTKGGATLTSTRGTASRPPGPAAFGATPGAFGTPATQTPAGLFGTNTPLIQAALQHADQVALQQIQVP